MKSCSMANAVTSQFPLPGLQNKPWPPESSDPIHSPGELLGSSWPRLPTGWQSRCPRISSACQDYIRDEDEKASQEGPELGCIEDAPEEVHDACPLPLAIGKLLLADNVSASGPL